MNNATLFTADRAAHANIVVVALIASIAVCLSELRIILLFRIVRRKIARYSPARFRG